MSERRLIRHTTRGFALIVVLFMLTVIAILFASSSKRSIAHQSEMAAEEVLNERNHLTLSLLRLAGEARWADPEFESFAVEINDTRWNIRLQDVGGLVDLNAGHQELIERLLAHLGLSRERVTDAMAAFQRYRREGARFQRVSDFARVTGLSYAELSQLQRLATVVSGRRGISPEHAPLEVLELATGRKGARLILEREVDEAFLAPPSTTTFLVSIGQEDRATRPVGTVSIRPGFANVLNRL